MAEVTQDDRDRLIHSIGKGYLDLLGARLGQVGDVTDAVAYPRRPEEVIRLLELAAFHGIAVVPYGGGTSVLGGLRPLIGRQKAVISVDLRHLNRVLEIDDISLLVRAETGITGPDLEEALNAKGLTLGHFPQSFQYSTLGGWISTRATGHLSGEYGRMEDMVQALRILTPEGEMETRSVPARSAGPGVIDLILGSEGTLGVVVDAVIRVRRKPESHARRALLYHGFMSAIDRAREMAQGGIIPSLFRVSDEAESSMIAYLAGLEAEDVPCFVLLGYEGTEERARTKMEATTQLWTETGALDIGEDPAGLWEEEYYMTPYLGDDLLARGLLVDTLETAASWSKLHGVHQAVSQSIEKVFKSQGIEGLVLCHLSHLYRDGASLYYTVFAPRVRGNEVEQWWEIKGAATEALLGEGATISHHHGVGVDHMRWMEKEHGVAGLRTLRALKDALDPKGIMNPGKVVREE